MSSQQAIRAALALLSRRDRRILGLLIGVQFLLALMDLVAIVLIGTVAALSAATVSGEPPRQVSSLLDLFGMADVPSLSLALILAAAAGLLFITKSILSFIVMRRSYRFLASRQAVISGALVSALYARSILEIQRRSSQEVAFALVQGAIAATLGVLGSAVAAASEVVLILVLFVAVFAIDPVLALFSVGFFGLVAVLIHRLLASWVGRKGKGQSRTDIESVTAIQDSLRTYRELLVSHRRALVVDRFKSLRWQSAGFQADIVVSQQIAKYVFEIALVIGGALIAYSQFLTNGLVEAVAVIAVFLAATSRVTPALLRLQSALLSIRSSSGLASPTLALAADLMPVYRSNELHRFAVVTPDLAAPEPLEFARTIVAEQVTYTYPGAHAPTIDGASLNVPAGTSLAIVGPTGAGKSTLVDLLLGILQPQEGRVLIGGVDPREAVARWPGSIAYVPQDIAVVAGSVRINVAIGLPPNCIDDNAVWQALEVAQLASLFSSGRDGLDTIVGEHGVRLSGGQRQRLGLARALYSRPGLIALDEATSALDAETEVAVTDALQSLGDNVTLVVIAHRLATVRNCEQVAYIQGGRIEHIGTFEEVRVAVPNFDRQAQLLGL